MIRQIEAPSRDWLTLDEAAAWIGVEKPTFRLLVKKGLVPPARPFTRKTKLWNWMDLVAAGHLFSIGFLNGTEVIEKGDEDDDEPAGSPKKS